ncbi:DNA polymerase IV [Peptoniphilus equinus]|uniref:DNA polymerase IV n=1 Tax=Peptoniphilus equinus TaxID=3016343 RepID=A0ABY7QU86_9FIRM|nr:DNA polymerase IV [Peptoniphilus equinus]WBW49585.1 DNA polymerase IV [Peptoniphilus equinus]
MNIHSDSDTLPIIHMDIDAFFAAVEELDDPTLKGKAVVVAGRSERGIITTANYEARKFGLHSAMPLFMARNLCPDLTVVPGHRSRYLEKSKEVFQVLRRFSPTVEKVSIDECYLLVRDGEAVAPAIQRAVYDATGLSVSCGVSYNKFLAKLASDWNKPHGLKVITPADVPDILRPLDIKKVHGLGGKSQDRLRELGINTIDELLTLDLPFLEHLFGKMGRDIYHRIRGVDPRPVTPVRAMKSTGVERTFMPTRDRAFLRQQLIRYAEELDMDLNGKHLVPQTLTLKLKDHTFKTITRSKTYLSPIYTVSDLVEKSLALFDEHYHGEKLRLIGITASNFTEPDHVQLNFLS